MKIPKRFKLLGSTISVSVADENFRYEDSNNDSCGGWAVYRRNQILLRPVDNIQVVEQAFWHELTHFVMYHAGSSIQKGCEWIHKEEQFVDLVGSLFMQAVNSFEYDE